MAGTHAVRGTCPTQTPSRAQQRRDVSFALTTPSSSPIGGTKQQSSPLAPVVERIVERLEGVLSRTSIDRRHRVQQERRRAAPSAFWLGVAPTPDMSEDVECLMRELAVYTPRRSRRLVVIELDARSQTDLPSSRTCPQSMADAS
jgi:hypothetical protein